LPLHKLANGRTRWTRIVYVVELDSAVCADGRSPCGGCGRTAVYVGQTCHSAAERFAQHKAGFKAGWAPKKYGRRLRPDLAGAFGEMNTVAESMAAEVAVANALRARGEFCVYGGH